MMQRILDQFALTVEAKSVRHRALEVVDAALQGPQRTLALRVNPPDVGGLTEAADDPVQERFQPEIGHQHRGCVPSATCAPASATAMTTNAATPRAFHRTKSPGRIGFRRAGPIAAPTFLVVIGIRTGGRNRFEFARVNLSARV